MCIKKFYSIFFLLFLFLRTGSLNFYRPHLCACVYEKKKMSRTFVVIFTRNIFLSLLSPCCVYLLTILIHISSFHFYVFTMRYFRFISYIIPGNFGIIRWGLMCNVMYKHMCGMEQRFKYNNVVILLVQRNENY